ncbi:CobW family GTP-binding protein [Vulgatibacter incomptus]|uniref:Putative metal chaperone, involved in Zn homeostasis n=1 Tax=Vulgatibacter incomptus TaxID=1391653 RepID=A0A0K1PG38_9BACT|nr:GTP-binding protein [Vulgatibacter incomptus]AKU92381.1 Putative metal chaperone, involved in Zn homeostasis [Vulgatibacter incomptus]
MRPPLPIVVLTGFLGAGKTTLLRRLLGKPHGLRIALIQNELGQAGIDVDSPASRQMIELTEGCVCCLRNPELLGALDDLWSRGDLDRVILETTGLADPLALTWTLARPELQGKVRLDSVVTVVDPSSFESARGEEWDAQVRCGDLIVLSKLELVPPEQVAKAIAAVREVNPQARILEGGDGLPEGLLLDSLDAVDAAGREARLAGFQSEQARHSDFGVVSVSGRQAYVLDRLEDWLEELPERVFRAKGIVEIEDGWVAFHVVGKRLQLELRAPAPAHGESRMALFGRDLDRPLLEEELARCRA